MDVKDELEFAKRRMTVRRQIRALAALLPPAERRTLLLDLLAEEDDEAAPPSPDLSSTTGAVNAANDRARSARDELQHALMAVSRNLVFEGNKAERTLAILKRPDGALVDSVAAEIYGAVTADTRKKAASMLSLLKSQGRAVKGLNERWHFVRGDIQPQGAD